MTAAQLRILEEYEQLDKAGKGALLRREGLYTSLLLQQRRVAATGRPSRQGECPAGARDLGYLLALCGRGTSMTAKPVAMLLADLGVTKSHSRPRVSNDNLYSESQFKTLKHHPTFPDRVGPDPRRSRFCQQFFGWYNFQHRHAGIALLTPADVHHGRADQVIAARAARLTCLTEVDRFRYEVVTSSSIAP